MTTQDAYIDFVKSLKSIYDERQSGNIADWVFENVTGLKKLERRSYPNLELNGFNFSQVQYYLKELLGHKPVQYVLKEAWFYRRKFFVNENVLIPRPETEELVEWVASDAIKKPGAPAQQTQVIDIGTGSGCIAISLKKELNQASVYALDISAKALQVAKKNATDLEAEIGFNQLDFLNEKEWASLSKYDIIVSNPPYIPVKEKELMARNVTDFEPPVALFVENKDPFLFYKKISEFAKTHLANKGAIYVEVHEEYAEEIGYVFRNAGFESEIKKDIYGKQRMVKAF